MGLRVARRLAAGALVLAGAGLLLLTIESKALMVAWYSRGAYYIVLALVAFWVKALVDLARERHWTLRSLTVPRIAGLGFCLLLTLVSSISVKTQFRVLSDETNLVAVSKAMLLERRTEVVTEGTYADDVFRPTHRVIDKRPLLFPFAIHLSHVVLGYRPSNVFLLNFLTLFAVFSLLYLMLERIVETPWVWCALILTAAQPIVSIAANSGCVDVFNVCFILIGCAGLATFIEYAGTAAFRFLWLTLLMLAHIRYESFIFLPITMTVLALSRRIGIRHFGDSIAVAATPLFVLPLIWQRVLTFRDVGVPEGTFSRAFGLDFFAKHSRLYFESFLAFDYLLPYATLVNLLGAVSLVYFAARHVRRPHPNANRRDLVLVSIGCGISLWLVTMFYFLGNVEHPTTTRLFLSFCIVFSVFAALLLREFARALRLPAAVAVLLSLCAFALYHPVAIDDRLTKSLLGTRQYQFVESFLGRQPKRDLLVISEWPNHFTVHDYSAFSFVSVNDDPERLLRQYDNRLYANVFVVQEIARGTGKATPGTALSPRFALAPLEEHRLSPESSLRISKVVNAPPGAPRAEPAPPARAAPAG